MGYPLILMKQQSKVVRQKIKNEALLKYVKGIQNHLAVKINQTEIKFYHD